RGGPLRPWPSAAPSRFAPKVSRKQKAAMAEVTLAIGTAAVCRDGFPGELKGLVVDPAAQTVTHLVIEPERDHGPAQGLARLVPLDHADASAAPLRPRYTADDVKDL